jgi:hypothetical protein
MLADELAAGGVAPVRPAGALDRSAVSENNRQRQNKSRRLKFPPRVKSENPLSRMFIRYSKYLNQPPRANK